MAKIKMLFVCGAGLGSSFAAQMSAEDVLRKLGVEADLDHVDISTAASVPSDIIITGENFKKQFERFSFKGSTSIIFLHNIVSKTELEEKLVPVLQEKGLIS